MDDSSIEDSLILLLVVMIVGLIVSLVRILIKAWPLLVIAAVILLVLIVVPSLEDGEGIESPDIPKESGPKTEPLVEQAPKEAPVTTYTVKSGDTLTEIADMFDTHKCTIAKLNAKEHAELEIDLKHMEIIDPEGLDVGWVLTIPLPLPIPPSVDTPPLQREEDKVMAKVIDDHIADYTRRNNLPDLPLVGKGGWFVYCGRMLNVDPRLLVAIAQEESGFAIKTCQGVPSASIHNAWGMGYPDCNKYESWEEGIASATTTIKGYFDCGRKSLESIGAKWCQNDPRCETWPERVSGFMQNIDDGDPNDLNFKVFGQ